jgi:phosphoglycerol transferase
MWSRNRANREDCRGHEPRFRVFWRLTPRVPARDFWMAVVLFVGAIALCRALLPLRGTLLCDGDAKYFRFVMASLAENGIGLSHPRLGAPFTFDMRDFPLAHTTHLVAWRLLGLLFRSPDRVYNVYFLLSFGLIAVSAFAVMRVVGWSTSASAPAALLYAFLPYHFGRYSHLALAAYYLVPPVVLIGMLPIRMRLSHSRATSRTTPSGPSFRMWAGIMVILIAMGFDSVYYPFFSCMTLLCAGLYAARRLRRCSILFAMMGACLVIAACVLVNHLPHIHHAMHEGLNRDAFGRSPPQVEYYSLRLAQLLLPSRVHRAKALRRLGDEYRVWGVLSEVETTTLGIAGSIGLIYLLLRFLFGDRACTRPRQACLHLMGTLGIASMLVAGSGGLLVLGAAFGFCALRAPNRIVVFLAFYALCGIEEIVEWVLACGHHGRPWRGMVVYSLIVLFLLGALWDQSGTEWIDDRSNAVAIAHRRQANRENRALFTSMESRIPSGSMVFQWPVMAMFGAPPVHHLPEYWLLDPCVASTTLHWSHGAMAGSAELAWQKAVAALPTDEMLDVLVGVGFRVFCIHRWGDPAAEFETRIERQLASRNCLDRIENGAYACFDLARWAQLSNAMSADNRFQLVTTHMPEVFCHWRTGVYDEESDGSTRWRWSQERGVLNLLNPLPFALDITVSARFIAPQDTHTSVVIGSSLSGARQTLRANGSFWEWHISIPHGKTSIYIHSDAQRVQGVPDPRRLVFMIQDFRCIALRPSLHAILPISSPVMSAATTIRPGRP